MSTSEQPALSIVIPVLDPGPVLVDQLRAIARQQLDAPWEVVIADNGCTDGSLEAALAEVPLDPVRVIDATARRGPSHARNRGAEEAKGGWLAFCDADDVVAVDWLDRLWTARGRASIVGGGWDVTRLNRPDQLKARGGEEYGRTLPEGPCDFLPYAPSCNLLVRRDLFQRLGGWDETLGYCEDVDFSWRAQLGGADLAFAADAVVHYRFRPTTRSMVRQVRRYKAAEAQLYRRYRDVGARRQSLGVAAGRYWWVVSRLPYLLLGGERRQVWFAVAASVLGRLEGSWRYRVWYP